MISAHSEFKLIERGFKDTIVLIPGWATDYRIFSGLELDYNYLLPVKFWPFDFEQELLYFLNQNSLLKISFFGWSLGGFVAAKFASQHPEKLDKLILLNIRKNFDCQALEEIKEKIRKNKKAYLYKFYLECFADNESEGLSWFKANFLKDYINKFEAPELISCLDYLSEAEINPESLSAIKKITIFHGGKDPIMPLEEAIELKSKLPKANFILLPEAGHFAFLNRQFKDKLANG